MAVAKAIDATWSVEVDGKDHGSVYTDCDWRFGTLIEARDKFRRMRPDPYASRAPKSLLHVVSTVSQSVSSTPAHPSDTWRALSGSVKIGAFSSNATQVLQGRTTSGSARMRRRNNA